MASKTTVTVDGLKELNAALRRLDKGLPKATKSALNGCSDFLIQKATPLIPVRSGKARRSLRARSSRTEVRIAAGGRAAPYYPWLDFGGTVGRGRRAAVAVGKGHRRTSSQQATAGSVRRPFLTEGRYLYPTLRKYRDEFTKIMETGLIEVAKSAGLDVS